MHDTEEFVVLDLTVVPESDPGPSTNPGPSTDPGPSTHPGPSTDPGPSALQRSSAPAPRRVSDASRAGGERLAVLTDTVLEAQRETLQAQRDTAAAVGAVAEELQQLGTIAGALQEIISGQERVTTAIVALTAAVTDLCDTIKNINKLLSVFCHSGGVL